MKITKDDVFPENGMTTFQGIYILLIAELLFCRDVVLLVKFV